jgi:uncharacterized membrane protein YuzA (DUF378 family)
MNSIYYLNIFAQILIIVGALNWGLIAVSDIDFVEKVSMGNVKAEKAVKGLVGVAGLYGCYLLYVILSK